MDPSDVEVRLFAQHLAQWLGAFSQHQVSECSTAVESLLKHGRHLCARPEFRPIFEAHARGTNCPVQDPAEALGALGAFLVALTATIPHSQYRLKN